MFRLQHRALGCLVALFAGLPCAAPAATAEEPLPVAEDRGTALPDPQTDDAAAELIRRERIRTTILDAFERVYSTTESREANLDAVATALADVSALGPDAIPFLVPEVQSPTPETYFVSVLALGKLGGPEAVEVLDAAMEHAEREPGKFALYRKMWTAIALGLAGRVEVLDIIDEGKDAGVLEVMSFLSALDLVAILTAPESVPRLLARLEPILEQPEHERMAGQLIKAAGRTGDPRVRTRCLTLLDHPSWLVRAECADVLRRAGQPEDLDRMMARLDDRERRVRAHAASYLEDLKSPRSTERLLALLETEEAPDVRRFANRALAALLGERALPVFRNQLGRPNYMERFYAAEAAGLTRHPKALNLLREMVDDPASQVRIEAIRSLARLEAATVRDTLLVLLRSKEWPVVRTAIEELVRLDDRRSAPRIADLLLNHAVPNHTATGLSRHRLQVMSRALVEFGYTEVLEDLRRAVEQLTDIDAAATLRDAAWELETIAELGTDAERWAALLGSEDALRRHLAYRRLARLGSDRAVGALSDAFDAASDEDRLRVLDLLARRPSPAAGRLARRVLSDPAFDALARREVRKAGAWLARRIGGEPMRAALRQSAERRGGRDYLVLVYLALLEGPDALPLIRGSLQTRIADFAWERGWENDELLWIAAQLSHGRGIERLDQPPDQHVFTE